MSIAETLESKDFQTLPVDVQVRLLAGIVGRADDREQRITDALSAITDILGEINRRLP
jgi:hypothetical protein